MFAFSSLLAGSSEVSCCCFSRGLVLAQKRSSDYCFFFFSNIVGCFNISTLRQLLWLSGTIQIKRNLIELNMLEKKSKLPDHS